MTTEQLQDLIETLERNKATAQHQADRATDTEWKGFYKGQVVAYGEALTLLELAVGPDQPTPDGLQADLLSVPDAARFTGLSPATLRRYIKIGRLSAVRLGAHKLRLRRADLQALVKEAE